MPALFRKTNIRIAIKTKKDYFEQLEKTGIIIDPVFQSFILEGDLSVSKNVRGKTTTLLSIKPVDIGLEMYISAKNLIESMGKSGFRGCAMTEAVEWMIINGSSWVNVVVASKFDIGLKFILDSGAVLELNNCILGISTSRKVYYRADESFVCVKL